MNILQCPKCDSKNFILSGMVKENQRYKCKDCSLHFSVLQKVGSISQELVNDILHDYLTTNLTISQIATKRKVSRTILNRWFKSEYWKDKDFSKNPFKKISLNSHYVEDITTFYKFASPTIRIKPRINDVKIQYLKDGYKTNMQRTVNLLTLFKFYQIEGEYFCSVKFNILSAVKNKLNLYNSSSEKKDLIRKSQETFEVILIEDFIDLEYYDKITPLEVKPDNKSKRFKYKRKIKHISNDANFIYGISVADLLEFILSNPDNFSLLIKLGIQAEKKLVAYQDRGKILQEEFDEDEEMWEFE